jgi:hypothetical protein
VQHNKKSTKENGHGKDQEKATQEVMMTEMLYSCSSRWLNKESNLKNNRANKNTKQRIER